MTKNYQELFNEALTHIRIAVSASVAEEAPLMRTIVKTLYRFSDELVKNGIIESREQGTKYEYKKDSYK